MFNPTEFSVFQWLLMPLFIFGRYVVPAGIFFLIFYVWKRQAWIHLKIQPKFPAMSDYQREIGFSALTSLIFGVVAWLCMFMRRRAQEYAIAVARRQAVGRSSVPLPVVAAFARERSPP